MALQINERKLAKNLFYNLAGLSLPTLIGLVTVPLLMNRLGLERFGLLMLLWIFLSYASLLDLGLGRAVTQQLAFRLQKNDSQECANLVWSSLYLLLLLGLVVGIVIFFSRNFLALHIISSQLAFQSEVVSAISAISLSMPLVIANDCMRGVLEAHHAFGYVNAVRFPLGVFTFVAPLVVIYFHGDLGDIACVLALGKGLTTLIYFLFTLRLMPELTKYCRFVPSEIIILLRLGGWMTVSNILNPLLGYADRFFIATVSLVSVSYYVTPNEMATKLWLIPGAITTVFFPLISAAIRNNPATTTRLYLQSLGLIALTIAPFVLILYFYAQPILALWLNAEFANHAYRLLQIFCIGIFINSLAQMPSTLIQARGFPRFTALTLLAEVPLYILGIYLIVRTSSIPTTSKLIDIAYLWTGRMLVDAIVMFALAKLVMRRIYTQSASKCEVCIEDKR